MEIKSKDIRIFYNKRTNDYVIANDAKRDKLLSLGYTKDKADKLSHGHIRSLSKAKKIKTTIINNKRVKSRNLWVLGCYIRVCDESYKYYDYVTDLYRALEDKKKDKQYFVNIQKGSKVRRL
jgi:hypothetical protein